MAFGRLERSQRPVPMSDINMTPLIDVMLVLLVIFMITAPLMSSSLKLDLPQVAGAQPDQAPSAITVSIDPQGRLYLGDEALARETFSARVAELARRYPNTEVQLRADKSVPYGSVAALIDMVQKAGLTRIGFVTESTAASGP